MVDEVKIDVEIRKDFSKHRLHELRNEEKIPAVIYGPEIENTPIVIDEKEFKEAISTEHGENVLLKVKLGNKKAVNVLIKEIQLHPITMKIGHVDLCQINMSEEIEVEVPLEVEGEAPGVKTEGGVLEHIVRNVKVRCLPAGIPDKFILDVSGLNIGDGLKIGDIEKIDGIEILDDPDSLAINVVAPTELEEPEEEVGVVEEGEEEPEVIGQKEKAVPAETKEDSEKE